jgi:hypothetical protein
MHKCEWKSSCAHSVLIGTLLVAMSIVGSDLSGTTSTAQAATWQTKTVRWGPIHVEPGDDVQKIPGHVHNAIMSPDCSGFVGAAIEPYTECINQTVTKPCSDCYIGKIIPNMVYEDGTTANWDNGMQLHHMVLLSDARDDLTCPSSSSQGAPIIQQLGFIMGGNERIMASGNERTIIDPKNAGDYGYYVGFFDEWYLILHITNFNPTEKVVYLEFTFEYATSGVTGVKPLWLDWENCFDSERTWEGGYTDIHWSWTASSAAAGTVVAIGGHCHGQCISVAIENATLKKNICTHVAGYHVNSPERPGPGSGTDVNHPKDHIVHTDTDPIYQDPRTKGGKGSFNVVESMSTCHGTDLGAIRNGDVIRMHTQYNKNIYDFQDMGISVVYLR